MGGALRLTLLILNRSLTVTAAVAGGVMCVFIMLSVFMRYFVGAPFRFTEELVGLLFAAMVFLVLPVAEIRNMHIRVTVLTNLFTPFWRAIAELGSMLAVVAFAVIFGLLSFDFAAMSYLIGSKTSMGGMLLYPWMGLMPLASGLLGFAVVLRHIEHLLAHGRG